MFSLAKECKITNVVSYTTAATSEVDGASVDMAGFNAVAFILGIGTAANNNGLQLQGSANNSDWSDLAGTAVFSDATSTVVVADLINPLFRYIRPQVERGTSTTIEMVTAIQYNTSLAPVTQGTDTTVEVNVSPAAGTV